MRKTLTRDEFVALRALHCDPFASLDEDVVGTLSDRQLVHQGDSGVKLTVAGRAEYLSELIRAFKFGVDSADGADWPSRQRH